MQSATEMAKSQPADLPQRTAKTTEHRERALSILAAEIRHDSNDDPVFYLIRSNTSHDGE